MHYSKLMIQYYVDTFVLDLFISCLKSSTEFTLFPPNNFKNNANVILNYF